MRWRIQLKARRGLLDSLGLICLSFVIASINFADDWSRYPVAYTSAMVTATISLFILSVVVWAEIFRSVRQLASRNGGGK